MRPINYLREALLHDIEPMVSVLKAYDALQKAVEEARRRVHSDDAEACLCEMEQSLADVRHDCSLAYVVDRCANGGL